MKIQAWENMVIDAVSTNDTVQINLIAQNLKEAAEAKQVLRDNGYGWTGLSLLETAKIVR